MNPLQGMLAATRRGLGSLKVVMATGLYKTAAGVVSARVVKENAEALRGYLTVHLRNAKAAQHALAGIEDAVEHGTSDMLTRGPSKRAALFLAAKNAVEYDRLFGDAASAPASAAPWEPAPPGRPDGWGRALDEVRFGLGAEEAELIELAHARSLNADEIAYVLSAPKDEVARKLEAAKAYAKLLVEDVFGDDTPKHLETIFTDAFAVLPPTPEDIAATKVKVVPLPAGTVIGDRYEIESRIGGGEFAYVYRARDVRVPGHVVALKLLHRVARTPAAREGAIRELSLIASAFHPSLVQFKDHGWFEDRLWFVMPFYDGEMLLDRLERGPLELDEALAHFERLARGLAALHAAGIRHQDVKPENIFLVRLSSAGTDTPEVFPVLLDLGVAAPNGEMALAGTPMYFAPEVAARIFDEDCAIPLTAKADVFALALSLLHSLEEPDLSELDGLEVDAFLKRRAEASPSGPRARALRHLQRSFARWLAPHPNERPTAGQLADEIAALRGGGRRAVSAPAGLRGAVIGLALTALLATSATLAGAPARPIQLIQAQDGTITESTRAPNETERTRVLRHRLEIERRRSRELEEELTRLRRRELGVEAPEPPAADAGAEPDPPTAREDHPASRHRG